MHRKFQQLLHDYKKQVFHTEHDKGSTEEIAAQCMHITEDVLNSKYHYHFHKLPDADRVEIINMINNYTREALLPPIVEKMVQRQVVLEKRIEALDLLTEQMLDLLSTEIAKA